MTPVDVTALFGEAGDPEVADRPASVASQCIYGASSLSGQLLQFRIFDSGSYFSKHRARGSKALRKLGSAAYVDPKGPSGIVDLQFVRDGHVYALAYSTSSGDAAARVPLVVALARRIDGRL
jgi:hypothetical protein